MKVRRILAVIGFSWLTALGFAAFLGFNAGAALGAACLFGFVGAMLIPSLRRGRVVPVVLLSAGLAFGSFCAQQALVFRPVLALDRVTAEISGRVIELPKESGETCVYLLSVDHIVAENAPQAVKMRLNMPYSLYAQVGERIEGEVKLYANDGQQDLATGVLLRAFPTGSMKVTPGELTLNDRFTVLRGEIMQQFERRLRPELAQVLGGVLLGESDAVSAQTKQDFRTSGLSHLLAVSGTHLSVLCGLLLRLLRALRVGSRLRDAIGCVFVLFFMALTGFAPSVVRAGTMFLILLFGRIIHREADSFNSLGIAALVLTLGNPAAGGDVGLLLSFSSTVGILLLSPRVENFLTRRTGEEGFFARIWRFIAASLAVTAGANLFNLPVSILVFREVSLIAPFSNLFASLPAAGMLLFGGLYALLSPFGTALSFLAQPCALVAGGLTDLLCGVARMFAGIPLASVSADRPYVAIWLCGTVVLAALAALAMLRPGRERLIRLTALLSACVLLCGMSVDAVMTRGVTSLILLRENGGTAAIITKTSRAAVLCVGDAPGLADAVLDRLRAESVRSVDALVRLSMTDEGADEFGKITEQYQIPVCDGINAVDGKILSLALWDDVEAAIDRQPSGAAMTLRLGETNILLATAETDLTGIGDTPYAAAIFDKRLPASYHRANAAVYLMTGEEKETAADRIRLTALEKDVFAVTDTALIRTKGGGEAELHAE